MATLNLCEVLDASLIERVLQAYGNKGGAGEEPCRVLFGSYFCDRLFMAMDWAQRARLAAEHSSLVSLVVPVFSQERLAGGKETVTRALVALGSRCDEVVVNDPAMAAFIQKTAPDHTVVLGRLLYKNPRDPRLPEYREANEAEVIRGVLLWARQLADVGAVEIDSFVPTDLAGLSAAVGVEVRLHRPLCYVTTGFICKAGSTHAAPEQKFRPHGACRFECQQAVDLHHIELFGSDYCRLGRTVYADAHAGAYGDAGALWFPARELMELGTWEAAR